MIKKFIPYLLSGAMLFTVGCAKNSDIDELKSKLGDLENRLEASEEAQKDALLAQLAQLQATIATLQSELDDNSANDKYLDDAQKAALEAQKAALEAALASQLESLQALETAIQENGSTVFYGNVITAEEHDAVLAQGATVVTGKVQMIDGMADKVAGVKFVGGSMIVNGEATLNIETVIGNLTVNGPITADMLTSAGGLKLASVAGLTTFPELLYLNGGLEINAPVVADKITEIHGDFMVYDMDEELYAGTTLNYPALKYIGGNFSSEGVNAVTGVNAPKLETILGDLNYVGGAEYVNWSMQATTKSFNIAANIGGNLNLVSLILSEDLITLSAGGSVYLENVSAPNFIFDGAITSGFEVHSCFIANIEAVNLTTVNGKFAIVPSFSNPVVDYEYYTEDINFDALLYVKGDFVYEGSSKDVRTTFDEFNALKTSRGATYPYISKFKLNMGDVALTSFTGFNSLYDFSAFNSNDDTHFSAEITIKADTIDAFNGGFRNNTFKVKAKIMSNSADLAGKNATIKMFQKMTSFKGLFDVDFNGVNADVDNQFFGGTSTWTAYSPIAQTGLILRLKTLDDASPKFAGGFCSELESAHGELDGDGAYTGKDLFVMQSKPAEFQLIVGTSSWNSVKINALNADGTDNSDFVTAIDAITADCEAPVGI